MEPSLDPEIAAWLAARGAADDAVDLRAARARVTAMGPQWDAATALDPDLVGRSSDVVAGVPVITWEPRDRPASATVIAVHGGGFTLGDARGAAVIAAPLAQRYGVRTISVDYRLAPEAPYPAAVDDVRAVLHAATALEPVSVWGDSAGAAIAIAAVVARPPAQRVHRLALACPALDDADCPDVWSPCLSRATRRSMWRYYLSGDAIDPAAAVPARMPDLSGLPATTVVAAEHDVLRAEAITFTDRLRAAGVDVDLHVVDGTVHGFTGLLHHTAIARTWNARVAAFLAGDLA